MGVCFQQIKEYRVMPKSNTTHELNLAEGWVWVVIRIEPVLNQNNVHDWHLQGIGADEELAVAMCADENYLIGPLPINTALPHDRIEWIGSYFPHRGKT
jgi:hypothetical protein